MSRPHSIDRPFLSIVIALAAFGFFIFISASLGLLAREGASFGAVAFTQAFLGLFLGAVGLVVCARMPYVWWRRYALYIYIAALILTLAVLIPGVGIEHGGARRWIGIGSLSFQPAEFLKIAFVIYFSAWAASAKDTIGSFRYGSLPLILILAAAGVVLLLQPNTSTLIVIAAAALAMFFAAGCRMRDIGVFAFVGVFLLGVLVLSRPYVRERFLTFLDPAADPLGSSYQVQQSLIAIGSGGFFGRGPGQSIQKFDYLPEPVGDSIFAVAAEEFGFVGSIALVTLFAFFAYRGLAIAARAPDRFGGLLVVGIVILVVVQSFINIAAMLGVIPLTGTPLLFVSKGGTALFFTLAEMGIVLNVSRYTKR